MLESIAEVHRSPLAAAYFYGSIICVIGLVLGSLELLAGGIVLFGVPLIYAATMVDA